MCVIILITGLPAVGKTTITEHLCDYLVKNYKVAYLSGDVIAHFSHKCKYADYEMDIKYNNIISLLNNFLNNVDFIIYEDFFKRLQDYEKVLKFIQNSNLSKFYSYTLQCSMEQSILRDKQRHPDHQLGVDKINKCYSNYFNLNSLGTITIDTETLTINDTINVMIKNIIC